MKTKKDSGHLITKLGVLNVVVVALLAIFMSCSKVEQSSLSINYKLREDIGWVKSSNINDFEIESELGASMKIYSLPDSVSVYASGNCNTVNFDLEEGEYYLEFTKRSDFIDEETLRLIPCDTNVYVSGHTSILIETRTESGLIAIDTSNVENVNVSSSSANLDMYTQGCFKFVYAASDNYIISINNDDILKSITLNNADVRIYSVSDSLNISFDDIKLEYYEEEL